MNKSNARARFNHLSGPIAVFGLSMLSMSIAQEYTIIPDYFSEGSNHPSMLLNGYADFDSNTYNVNVGERKHLEGYFDGRDVLSKIGAGTLYIADTSNKLNASEKHAVNDSFVGTFTIKQGTVVSGGDESLGGGLYKKGYNPSIGANDPEEEKNTVLSINIKIKNSKNLQTLVLSML